MDNVRPQHGDEDEPLADSYPDVDDVLGADPEWTGGLSVDDYMDRERGRSE